MARMPFFKLYSTDWLGHVGLAGCSLAARGLFVELLCLMNAAEARGRLADARGPWSTTDVLKRLRGDPGALAGHLRELIDAGVVHTDADGALFSPKMVRDDARQRTGEKFGGRSRRENSPSHSPSENSDTQIPRLLEAPSGVPSGSPRGSPSGSQGEKQEAVCREGSVRWSSDGGFVGIGPKIRAAWAAAYPSVDIDAELAKAHVWLLSNPTRAGKRAWRRFLTGWMQRTHEHAGTLHGSSTPRRCQSGAPVEPPSDPDAHARYDALVMAGVSPGTAARMSAIPHLTVEIIRRVSDAWTERRGPKTGVFVMEMETAAEQARIRAERLTARNGVHP